MIWNPDIRVVSIWIEGVPKPAGSKRAFPIYRGRGKDRSFTGHTAIVDACTASRAWKTTIAWSAKSQFHGPPLTGPLRARFEFFVARPQDHFGHGKNQNQLKASAPSHPAGKPDVLKLTRAAEDALSGIVYVDDAQIVHEEITKEYTLFRGAFYGVAITIQQIQ